MFTAGLTSTGASPPLPQKTATSQAVVWPHGRHPGRRPLMSEAMVVVVFHFALGSEMAWILQLLVLHLLLRVEVPRPAKHL